MSLIFTVWSVVHDENATLWPALKLGQSERKSCLRVSSSSAGPTLTPRWFSLFLPYKMQHSRPAKNALDPRCVGATTKPQACMAILALYKSHNKSRQVYPIPSLCASGSLTESIWAYKRARPTPTCIDTGCSIKLYIYIYIYVTVLNLTILLTGDALIATWGPHTVLTYMWW